MLKTVSATLALALLAPCSEAGQFVSPALRARLAEAALETLPTSLRRARAGAGFAVVNSTVMIPMRDGVLLNTNVYLPSPLPPGVQIGTVMMRTPYGAASFAANADAYASLGWASIVQDERGRFASGGAYTMWASAANDTYDTLAYVRSQLWSNGLIASTGGSAGAIEDYVTPLADPAPPTGMASQFNIVGMSTLHEMEYQGGAYRQSLISGWLTEIGEPGSIAAVQAHEGWGPFWESTTQSNGRWGLTDWPVLHVAGWYDIFSTLQLETYLAIVAGGGPAARGEQFMIVVPGGHCAGGAIAWPNASWGMDLAQSFSLQVFASTIGPGASGGEEEWWRDARAAARLLRAGAGGTQVVWYVLGPGTLFSTGNFWAAAAAFPAPTPLPCYLRAGGALSLSPPEAQDAPATGWTADPSNPIPTYGGNNLLLSPCGPQDQRGVEANFSAAMALFESDTLADALAVTGPLAAALWVSSSALDTDVAVKVTDVFPTGESMLVQDGIARLRWRGGPFAADPAPPLAPGQAVAVNVSVGWMSYIFNAGHRIRVAVSSANYPRFSANPNTGAPLANATAPPVVAANAVLHDPAHPSALLLPVVPLEVLLAARV